MVVSVYDGEARPDAVGAIRETVFVEEQDVPAELEYDGRDDAATHALARDDGGEAVGTARLRRVDETTGKLERMAVLRDHRGEGWGRRLVGALESTARDRGVETIVLHAQRSSEGFYEALGYTRHGDVFEEAGMAHVEMRRSL